MSTDLTPVQTAHAETIVACVKHAGMPVRAAHIALETARAESNLLNYANSHNPESLALPHDAVGSDHGSVGLFQQQVGGAPYSTANWGTTAELMNPAVSTAKFLEALSDLDWTGPEHTNWGDAQAVQHSAFSDGSNYRHWDAWAISLGNALWQTSTGTPGTPLPPTHLVRRYDVQHNDTLSSIAHRYYGSSSTWPRIYAANHALIGANPNLIYPGQILVIP